MTLHSSQNLKDCPWPNLAGQDRRETVFPVTIVDLHLKKVMAGFVHLFARITHCLSTMPRCLRPKFPQRTNLLTSP